MPVVDANVAVEWIAPGADPDHPIAQVREKLLGEKHEVVGPRLLLEEASNVLITGIRRRRWTAAQADVSWMLLRDLPVRLVDGPEDLARAWELSRRHDEHPIYDMLYVAVAERYETQLITADTELRHRLAGTGRAVSPEEYLA